MAEAEELAELWEAIEKIREAAQQHALHDAEAFTKILGYDGNPNGSMLGDIGKLKAGVIWKDQLEALVGEVVDRRLGAAKQAGRSVTSHTRERVQIGVGVVAIVSSLVAVLKTVGLF